MSTKATMKSTLFTAGILAVVIGIGGNFLPGWQRTDTEDDRTERVTMSVAFTPNLRTKVPIQVIVSVDSVVLEKYPLRESPWSRTITIPKGAQVSLYANQETGGELSCTILAHNAVVDVNTRKDIGSIRCWYNRKK